jgi:hypothetical protein
VGPAVAYGKLGSHEVYAFSTLMYHIGGCESQSERWNQSEFSERIASALRARWVARFFSLGSALGQRVDRGAAHRRVSRPLRDCLGGGGVFSVLTVLTHVDAC